MATATVIASTLDMTREDWLKARKMGIGGSDAAKVVGISKYGGPLEVYMDKKGELPPYEAGEAAHWGIILEDVVAKEFAERTGFKVRKQNKMFAHPDYPWMIANVDRVLVGENVGLECKTANTFLAKEWVGDELPDSYYCQVQHYIAVMGWESCWIAVLIGGQKFNFKEVLRDDGFIKDLIEKERDFWENHFIPGIPPELGLFDAPKRLYPVQDDQKLLPAEDKDISLVRHLVAVNEDYKAVKRDKEHLENQLKARIKEHEGIEGVCTWKQGANKVVTDWEAVANALHPSGELIEMHSKIKEGTKRFNLKYKGVI